MFIKVGGSLENPGGIVKLPFKAAESRYITPQVVKCIDPRGNIPEIRFQTPKGEAFISGYLVNPKIFHITSIVNQARKKREFDGLITVLTETFNDLKKDGVGEVTIYCRPNLVPIAMKRYGFVSPDGFSLDDVMKKSLGLLKVTLIKKL